MTGHPEYQRKHAASPTPTTTKEPPGSTGYSGSTLDPQIQMAPASQPPGVVARMLDKGRSMAGAFGRAVGSYVKTPAGLGNSIVLGGSLASPMLAQAGRDAVGAEWRINDAQGRMRPETAELFRQNMANNFIATHPERVAWEKGVTPPGGATPRDALFGRVNHFDGAEQMNAFNPRFLTPDADRVNPQSPFVSTEIPAVAHERFKRLVGAQDVAPDLANARFDDALDVTHAGGRVDPKQVPGYFANIHPDKGTRNLSGIDVQVNPPTPPIPGRDSAEAKRLRDVATPQHADVVSWDGNLIGLAHELGHAEGNQTLRDYTHPIGALKGVAQLTADNSSPYPGQLAGAVTGGSQIYKATTGNGDMSTLQRLGLLAPATAMSALVSAPALLTLAEETRANINGYRLAKQMGEGAGSAYLKGAAPGYLSYVLPAVPAAITTAALGKALYTNTRKYIQERKARAAAKDDVVV